jgi:soluble lytic murein transglycosylase
VDRGRRPGSRRRGLKRVLALAAVAAVAAGAYVGLEPRAPAWYERARYPLAYDSIIRAHARNYRLDPALLAAVIYQESKFRAGAESPSGAIGLMQLLPDTAKGIALRTGGTRFVVNDLYEPELNVRYGSWYLRHLLDKYDDTSLALAAYNAGQRNVDEWRRRGVAIQFPETRAYVERVLELRDVYRSAYDLT